MGRRRRKATSGRGFFGGVAEQYTYFDTFQSGGHDAPNPDGEYLNSLISQAFVGYNLNERFGLQFNLPVIYRAYGRMAPTPARSGIGDVSLIGNVRLYQKLTEDGHFQVDGAGRHQVPDGQYGQAEPGGAGLCCRHRRPRSDAGIRLV